MGFLSGLFGGGVEPKDLAAEQQFIAESNTQIIDSVAPRSLCLGDRGWSGSVAWRQTHNWGATSVGASEDPKEALTDVLVIGDHEMGVTAGSPRIWIDEEVYTYGTDSSGTGDDFHRAIPAAGEWHPDLESGQWYVPNKAKSASGNRIDPLWRAPSEHGQDDISRPVLAFKLWDGSQVAHVGGDWLGTIFGWADETRIGTNCTLLATTWRYGVSEWMQPGRVPSVMLECRGHSEVYDWRTASYAYTNNPVLCWAHWLMWEYGPFQRVNDSWVHQRLTPASFHSSTMQASADVCEQTSVSFTGQRYNCNYQIYADQDPEDVMEQFSLITGGGRLVRIGSQWAIVVGHSGRTWVAGFDMDDLSASGAIITPTRRSTRERYNTVVGQYPGVGAGWDIVETDPVTDAAYRSADDDKVRSKTIKFSAIGGSAARSRAERLLLIWLDRHRLEDQVELTCQELLGTQNGGGGGAALAIAAGGGADIIRLTYPTKGWTDKEFEVVRTEWRREDLTVRMRLEEWSSGIRWDGVGDPPDETYGDVQIDRKLTRITGLDANPVANTGIVQPDGTVLAKMLLEWTAPTEHSIVVDVGSYRIHYRLDGETDWASTIADEARKELDLIAGEDYDWRVRIELPGIKGKWSSIDTFTATAALDIDDPPMTIAGANMWGANWDLERKFPNPRHWDIVDEGTALTATASYETSGGYWGGNCIRVDITGGTAGLAYDLKFEKRYGVRPGDVMVIGYSATSILATGTRIKAALNFFDVDKNYISGSFSVADDYEDTAGGAWRHRLTAFDVPDLATDIAYMSPELQAVYRSTTPALQRTTFDGFHLSRARGWSIDWDDAESTTTSLDPNWAVIMGVGNPNGLGSGGKFCRDGQKFAITFNFETFLESHTNGTLGDDVELRVRCVRYDVDADSNTATLIASRQLAFVADATSVTAGDEFPDVSDNPNRFYSWTVTDEPTGGTTVIWRVEAKLTGENDRLRGVFAARGARVEILEVSGST